MRYYPEQSYSRSMDSHLPPLWERGVLAGGPACGQILDRCHEIRAPRFGNAAFAVGLAGFGDRHPEEPLGVLPDHLPVSRLVPRVAADGEDLIEEGLLGAVERGVRRVCTRLGLLGELLGQLPADFAGLLVLKKFMPRPVGNDVVLLAGGLAVFPPGQKPFAYQFAMRGI
jgi:hypothetical protein